MDRDKSGGVLKLILLIFVALMATAIIKTWLSEEKWNDDLSKYRLAVENNSYVAHALGGVDGHAYTNSKESLESSLYRGFRFLEADIRLTSDEKLVLTHGWGKTDYEEKMGLDYNPDNNVMSYDDFMNSRFFGLYTPLDFSSLLDYMKQYSDLYVMLDFGKQDGEYLKIAFDNILAITDDEAVLDRMIVGGHNTEMVEAIRDVYDFKFYNLYWAQKSERLDSRIDTKEEFLTYCRQNKITSVSTSVATYNAEKSTINYFKKNGLIVYLYTVNDEKQASEYFQSVDMVGTDFINLK